MSHQKKLYFLSENCISFSISSPKKLAVIQIDEGQQSKYK